MERYVRFIVHHRLAVVGVVLAVTALLATQLRYVYSSVAKRRGVQTGKALRAVPNAAKRRGGLETTGGAVQQFQGNIEKR